MEKAVMITNRLIQLPPEKVDGKKILESLRHEDVNYGGF
jgi:hypothetical protein